MKMLATKNLLKTNTCPIQRYFGFKRDYVLQTQVLCKTRWKLEATVRGNMTHLHFHFQYQDLNEEFQKANASKTKAVNVRRSKSTTVQQTCVSELYKGNSEKTLKWYKEMMVAIPHYLAKDKMNTVS